MAIEGFNAAIGKYTVIVIRNNGNSAKDNIEGVYRASERNFMLIDENLPRAIKTDHPGSYNDSSLQLHIMPNVDLTNDKGEAAKGNCRIVNTSSGPRVICY